MPTASLSAAATASAAFNSIVLTHPRITPSFRSTVSFRARRISCEAAAVTTSEISSSSSCSSDSISYSPEEREALGRVGSKIKVKVPLKVSHVMKVPELDLEGMEGKIKQYVAIWKGKRISANLPFKVEFVLPDGVEGRPGPIKFFAHLREDEFDYLPVD